MGAPFQGRYPASEVNDGTCPEKPDQLTVELDLPPWTVARDVDLRSWLFNFGGGIRIEQPEALRQELVERCQKTLAANNNQVVNTADTDQPVFFPSRIVGNA